MEEFGTSFCSPKFPRANEIICLKSIEDLGTLRKKVSPALIYVISLYLIEQLAVTSLTRSQEYNKRCRRSCSMPTHDRYPLHSRTHPRDLASPFFNVYDLEEHIREKGQTAMLCAFTWTEKVSSEKKKINSI
jgi:hypothetical protein